MRFLIGAFVDFGGASIKLKFHDYNASSHNTADVKSHMSIFNKMLYCILSPHHSPAFQSRMNVAQNSK